MKRFVLGVLTATLGAVLAACGAPASNTSTGSTGAATTTGSTSATATGMEMATTTGSMSGTTTGMEMATTTGSMSSTTTGMEMATTTGSMSGTTTAGGAMATTTGSMSSTTTGMEMATTTGSMSGTTTAGGTMASTAMAGAGTIIDVAAANGSFTTLLTALQLTGLDKQLAQAGQYTVFAPTDAAFAALPPATLQALLANPAQLQKILSYHVAQGDMKASAVSAATSIPTLEGQAITVAASGGTVTLNGTTKITMTDIQTSNGVIHVIDKVLLPPDVQLP